jgi:hypothetical protein
MIHQSRKWRMIIRIVTLTTTSVLMLVFAGPVSYALQADTPKPITGPTQLYDKEKPISDAFVEVRGVPQGTKVVSTEGGGETHYWVPLHGYDQQMFVRTELSTLRLPEDLSLNTNTPTTVSYVGKITKLSGQANSQELMREMEEQGIKVDKERAMVLLEGEQPSSYRPIVPVIPVLAWIWLAALVGLVQIMRGRQTRRVLGQSTLAARNVR